MRDSQRKVSQVAALLFGFYILLTLALGQLSYEVLSRDKKFAYSKESADTKHVDLHVEQLFCLSLYVPYARMKKKVFWRAL